MPNTMHWEPTGLLRVFAGKLTAEEILASNLALQGDARFDDIQYIINDFLSVTELELDESALRLISEIDKAASLSNPDFKIALVVSLEEFRAWAEKYSHLMVDSTLPNNIFNTRDEAYTWVGIDSAVA